jgi:hypothetical protein
MLIIGAVPQMLISRRKVRVRAAIWPRLGSGAALDILVFTEAISSRDMTWDSPEADALPMLQSFFPL